MFSAFSTRTSKARKPLLSNHFSACTIRSLVTELTFFDFPTLSYRVPLNLDRHTTHRQKDRNKLWLKMIFLHVADISKHNEQKIFRKNQYQFRPFGRIIKPAETQGSASETETILFRPGRMAGLCINIIYLLETIQFGMFDLHHQSF